ncbi:SCAN domain-containing protein 3-like, partial [Aphis craccivora]
MYEIGNKEGRLSTLYSRNQFRNFLEVDDMPHTKISLREAARKFSNLGSQGYDQCTCVKKCKTRKCKCKAAERLYVHQNFTEAVHETIIIPNSLNYFIRFLYCPIYEGHCIKCPDN